MNLITEPAAPAPVLAQIRDLNDNRRPGVNHAFLIPANSPKIISFKDLTPNKGFSTRVHGSKPTVAETFHTMGFPRRGGLPQLHGVGLPPPPFWPADGQSSDGRETWTLVKQPAGRDPRSIMGRVRHGSRA